MVTPAVVAATYAGVGFLWIGSSDWLFRRSPAWVSAGKGLLYVAATAVILFWVLRRRERMIGQRDGALRTTKGRLSALADASADFTAIFGRDLGLDYLTDSVEGVLGWGAAELGARFDASFVHRDDVPMAAAAFDEVVAGGSDASRSCSVRVRHAEGGWRRLACVVVNRLDDPAVGGVVVHARDVTADHEQTVVITSLLAGSARLAKASTEAEVAAAVLDACLAAVGASGGAVRRLDTDARVLVPLLARNLELVAHWTFSLDGPSPIARAARTQQVVTLANPAEIAALPAGTVPPNLAAIVYLPMLISGRTVGTIGLGFDRPRALSQAALDSLLTFAHAAALALERTRLEAARRAALVAAADAAARTDALRRVAEAFSRSVTVDEVIAAAVAAMAQVLQPSTAGATVRLDEQRCRQWAWDVAGNGRLRDRPMLASEASPVVAAVLADGCARFYDSAIEVTADLGRGIEHPFPLEAGAFVPLVIDDEPVGLLGVTFSAARRLAIADRELLSSLATLCSEALRRARHFEQAQQSAARYEELFDNYQQLFRANPIPMVVYDADQRMLATNRALELAFGYDADELATMTMAQLVAGAERHRATAPEPRAPDRSHEHLGVLRMRRKDGSMFFMEVSSHVGAMFAGRRARIGLLVDQTARVEAEEANKALQTRVISVAEEERRRLAADLHDGPVQQLSIANMRLSALRRRPAMDQDSWRAQVDKIARDLTGSIDELRAMMQQLYPQALEQMTLAEAINATVVELSWAAGLQVRVEDALQRGLPTTVKAALYRVAMEALQNVQKHAAASEVTIELCEDGDAVELRVTDDGVGIEDGAPARPGHLGLPSMRDRILLLGGECRIVRAGHRGGTLVQARVPLLSGV